MKHTRNEILKEAKHFYQTMNHFDKSSSLDPEEYLIELADDICLELRDIFDDSCYDEEFFRDVVEEVIYGKKELRECYQ